MITCCLSLFTTITTFQRCVLLRTLLSAIRHVITHINRHITYSPTPSLSLARPSRQAIGVGKCNPGLSCKLFSMTLELSGHTGWRTPLRTLDLQQKILTQKDNSYWLFVSWFFLNYTEFNLLFHNKLCVCLYPGFIDCHVHYLSSLDQLSQTVWQIQS